ncbi:Flap-structured DNA-binding and RNA-binding protein [Malassezia cuniculi]|uniref:RNA-binding protein VTS1 n=1 Tax=Malassezia cuniculi TaxID=948313 RepID=A0AAF0EVL7_9BASI|nr:Flap-structured DNA-binding and RNA-binding protein [Malassezia cuniculi]
MSNPLRYSHGKLGDGLMRVPQQSQQGSESGRMSLGSSGQVPLASRTLRPSSEMINTGQQGTPETEVIDKWFEDLHTYEATLEEMAAASLDQNFKEELSAIEQWFRVLSEAERTAALYSLLQESTQVQVRFFITVLQQMTRNDPVGAFLSPSAHNSAIGDQLEAKMASLGIKSPSGMKPSSSPSGRFQRQSTGFLSPNSASLYSGSSGADVSAALAAQRSRMKNNRTSAPGTLLGESRPYSGGILDDLQEKSGQQESRPKSSEAPVGRSPRSSGPLDDGLAGSGSWASMVNTPIMAMLDEPQQNDTNAKLDAAMAQLAQLGQDAESGRSRRMGSGGMLGGMYEQGTPAGWNPASPSGVGASPQFNNFNVATMSPNTLAGLQSPSGGLSNPVNLQMMNAMAAMGGLNNMNSSQLLALQQQILQSQQQTQLQQARMRQRGFPQSATSTPRTRADSTPRVQGSPTSATQGVAAEEEVADISILNDVPAWLRHLRLHKYTPNFEGSNWREMVLMDDQALEEKGVAAMGARRKMLKTFEAVRQKYGISLPEGARTATSGTDSAQSTADADK